MSILAMRKYWVIVKAEFQRQLTYRTNILGYVAGNFINLFAQIVVWTAVYNHADLIKGYTYEEMMSYVVIGWVFMFLTTNYGYESIIASHIHEGTMSNFIVKPLGYLRFAVANASGRVIVALLVVIVQGIVYILLFHGYMASSLSPVKIIVLLLMLLMSYLSKLFMSILIGYIAFWTMDISGVFNTAGIITRFLSGSYFPMNLLPAVFLNISMAFPFIYTLYVPALYYIDKLSLRAALLGLLVQLVWLVIMYFAIKLLWKKGVKIYESAGI